MKRIDFFLLLSENLFDYIVILLITTIIMWGIIKKSCDSLINPLCFNLIMAAFANTVPIFLFVESIIDFNYFIYFTHFNILLIRSAYSLPVQNRWQETERFL